MAEPLSDVPIFQPYWVLLIDLAGFSDAIERDAQKAAALYSKGVVSPVLDEGILRILFAYLPYTRGSEPIVESTALSESGLRKGWLSRVRIFSDSIFVFFDGDSKTSSPFTDPCLLLPWSLAISSILWIHGIAHRGAIAFGDCYITPDSVFLGKPIVKAHRWEQAQDWFGISVEPGSQKEIGRLRDGVVDGLRLLAEHVVPTKHGRICASCLELRKFLASDFIGFYTNAMLRGFYRAFDDAIARSILSAIPKYVETEQFFLKCGMPETLRRSVRTTGPST